MGTFSFNTPTNDNLPSKTPTIVAPLSTSHTHTIIFLHGREDFGEDLAQYFFDSKASNSHSLAKLFPTTKWVFPTAKLRYSAQRDFELSSSSFAAALKGEEIISQQFDVWDIKTSDEKQELMIPGLRESVRDIVRIIHEEVEMVPLERIVLGGIRQRCATAVYTLLCSGLNLGGFVGLSSWLPFQNVVETLFWSSDNKSNDEISRKIRKVLKMVEDEPATEENIVGSEEPVSESHTWVVDDLETMSSNLAGRQQSVVKNPVFLSHSRDDETIPFTHGQDLYKNLKNLGFDVT